MKSGVKSIYKPAQIDKTTATTRHLSSVLSKQFFASVFPAVNMFLLCLKVQRNLQLFA